MNLIKRSEYCLFLLLAFIIRVLPRGFTYTLGRTLGVIWAIIDRRRFGVAFQNINLAFPELSLSEKRKMAYGCFKNMALSGVDLFRLDLYTKSDFEKLFDVEGEEILKKIHSENKSVIFMSAHIGFWESGSFVFKLFDIKACLIAKKIKNVYIDNYILHKRTTNGIETIDRQNGLRKIIKSIQENKSIAIMIDQHVHKEEAVYVPFFGRKAYTSPIIVSLAAKKKLDIVPIFCYRVKNRFKLVVQEPIKLLEDQDEGFTNTTNINQILENAIRKYPEQWMWLHRRWR